MPKTIIISLTMAKVQSKSFKHFQSNVESLKQLRNSKWFNENRTRSGLLLKPAYKKSTNSNISQADSQNENSNKLSVIPDVEQSQTENKSLCYEQSSNLFPQKSRISKYLNGLKIESISIEPSVQILEDSEKVKPHSAQKTKKDIKKDLATSNTAQQRQAISNTSVISINSDQLNPERSKPKPINQNKIQNVQNIVKAVEKKRRGRKSNKQRQAILAKKKLTENFEPFEIKIHQLSSKKEKIEEKKAIKEQSKQQSKQATQQASQKQGIIVLDDDNIYDSICKQVQIEVFNAYRILCQNSLRVLQLTKRSDNSKQKLEQFIKEEFRNSLSNSIRISIGETATKCQASIAEVIETLSKKEYQ